MQEEESNRTGAATTTNQTRTETRAIKKKKTRTPEALLTHISRTRYVIDFWLRSSRLHVIDDLVCMIAAYNWVVTSGAVYYAGQNINDCAGMMLANSDNEDINPCRLLPWTQTATTTLIDSENESDSSNVPYSFQPNKVRFVSISSEGFTAYVTEDNRILIYDGEHTPKPRESTLEDKQQTESGETARHGGILWGPTPSVT